MTAVQATTALQPIRTIVKGGAWTDDPAVATTALAALDAWYTSGKSRTIAVHIAAVDASGVRVPGVKADVSAYFFQLPTAFGLTADKPEVWHEGNPQSAVSLDRPFYFETSDCPKMGVRIAGVNDPSLLATELRIAVQEMPRV